MRSELAELAPAHWARRPIQDVCVRVTSGGTPSRSNPEFYEDGEWAWVKTQELLDSWIDDTEEHITEIAVDKSSAKILPEQTILLALYGATVGQLGILRRPMTCNQACCAIIVNPDEADYRYLFYLLIASRRQLKSLATGAAQQNLSGTLIKNFVLPFPKLEVQQRIADILGKLDDKIELNRRMNRTLEKMAAAIFKNWFIDFDPVHAKAEGRDPNLPAEIADLFPDTFEDSDLGPIPKGWDVGPLSDLAELKTKAVKPGGEPETLWDHYSIPAYDEGQQPKRELGETIKSNKYVVPERSVLVSKLNPRFPRIWLPATSSPEKAICSTEFMPFVPCRDGWRPYVYELMKSQLMQDKIMAHVSGSTGSRQRVKPKEIAVLPVAVPPAPLIDAFCEQITPLHDRLLVARAECVSLAKARDTLLPKLISGELSASCLHLQRSESCQFS